jgi:hypothetical protein
MCGVVVSDEAESALKDPLVQFEDKRVDRLLAKDDKTAVEFVTLLVSWLCVVVVVVVVVVVDVLVFSKGGVSHCNSGDQT